MTKLLYFVTCTSCMLVFAGCMPTVVSISVTETVAPNGDKTVSTTKFLSQQVSHTQTTSTDQVLDKFK